MRAVTAALIIALAAFPSAVTGKVLALDVRREYRPEHFQTIGEAVGASSVVSLGEAIHLTREMPLVRLGVLRYLHEQRGFNVLALEGALIDIWTAQEDAYRSREALPHRTRAFARESLFGLWQTEQMEQVVSYALATQHTRNPLYLASFDIQPGTARAHGGSAESSVQAFIAAIRAAGPNIGPEQAHTWSKDLGPALNCRGTLRNDSSLRALDQAIDEASIALQTKRPRIHVDTLRLVPEMLRRRLQHCRQVAAGGSYQALRDRHNAALVHELLERSGKLVLWAHHSHIHHNSLKRAVPSMGEHLKRSLRNRLYTIGVFAAAGNAVDSTKLDAAQGPDIVFALASLPLPQDERFDVERRLAATSKSDFFIDLRREQASWSQPSTSRLEVDLHISTALSRDFDGAILLHRVTGAELNFLPRAIQLLANVAGWILQNRIIAGLAGVSGATVLMWLIRAALRRRRKQRVETASTQLA